MFRALTPTYTHTSAAMIIFYVPMVYVYETPMCDTTPPTPTPTVPVSTIIPSTAGSSITTSPSLVGIIGMFGKTVPTTMYMDLLEHYHGLLDMRR